MRAPTRLASLALLAALLVSSSAFAGQPRLDRVASERGLAPKSLAIASSKSVALSGSSIRAELHGLHLNGIPLRGGFETIWRAGEPSERVVAARYPAAPPQLRPEQARLDLDAARLAATPLLRADLQDRIAEVEGELVYLLILDRPVLAWELTTPVSLAAPAPSRLRLWISAGTGRLLESEELVFTANEAEVFRFNPQQTPDPITVTLSNLDPAQTWSEAQGEGTWLNGSRVRVFNCIDAEQGPFAPWRGETECWPTQEVSADQNGDFFVPLPNVGLAADNIAPGDLYAELSMYYHAEVFFSALEQHGVEGFPCELSNMVANFHWLESAPEFPELDYGPYNNAFYSGECEIEKGPTMLFGQGSAVDFAFDGDVVYHELGHGIVDHLTPEGLRTSHMRSDGLLRDARGLNEAIADYHTLMITDRPELADYVGFYWAELDRAWIRNADNDRICPRDMTGEEHYDGEPFTAALWSARRRIGAERLDPLVLGMLPLLAPDATLEQAAAALLELAAAERDAGTWTDADIEQLERALEGRGLLDCPRIAEGSEEPKGDQGRFLYLRAKTDTVTPFWPGPLQLRHEVPPGSDNLLLSFRVSAQGNSAGQPVGYDVEPRVLIKRGGEPIHFEYELTSLGHASPDKEDLDEVTFVTGDWDEIVAPAQLSDRRRQVLIRELEPGEVVHVGFVNISRQTAVISEVFLGSVPSEDLDQGSPSDDQQDDDPSLELDAGSCACTSTSGGGNGGSLALGLLLVLAGVGSRRPSRRRAGESLP